MNLGTKAKALIAVFVKLGLGTIQYILLKDIITTQSQDSHGETKKFESFWFLTFITVFFMVLCALPVIPGEYRKYRSAETDSEGALINRYNWQTLLLTTLPAALDVTALRLSYGANKHLVPTVVVLLKGSRAIFTAGLTSLIVKKRQTRSNWMGILVTSIGVGIIALEAVLSNMRSKAPSAADDNSSMGDQSDSSQIDNQTDEDVSTTFQVVIALLLTLGAEVARAIRFVYEERLIKITRISAQMLVLAESCYGLVFATTAWLIACSLGKESLIDTFVMIGNSGKLLALIIVVMTSSGLCNVAGAFITKYLSSVHNALVSEMRVVFVFIPQIIRYKVDEKKYPEKDESKRPGEKLDWFSLIKIAGFIFLIFGAMIYNGSLKLPFKFLYAQQFSSDASKDSSESNNRPIDDNRITQPGQQPSRV